MNINRNYLSRAITAMLLSLALISAAVAQDEKERMSTLFGGNKGQIDYGGWAGLNFGYNQVDGKDTYKIGARGGVLINHRFTIGLAGNGFFSDREYDDIIPDHTVRIAGGYGGLFMEATLFPFFPVHLSIPVIIGAGGVAYTSNNWSDGEYYWGREKYDSDAYFLLEPGLEVELNLIKFMRLAVGGTYRFTSDIDMVNTSSGMLRGLNWHFCLKFGSF